MIEQEDLFRLITSKFGSKAEAARAIAAVLYVQPKAARRWINAEVRVSYDMIKKLVEHFDIKGHEIMPAQQDTIHMHYTNLVTDDPTNYLRYMDRIAGLLEQAVDDPAAEIGFVADDIPIFHFMPYKELIYFKLFAYRSDVQSGEDLTFEQFCEQMEPLNLANTFQRIDKAYAQIASTEIWGATVLQDILFRIRFLWDTGRFALFSSVEKLLDLLKDLVEKFNARVVSGQKDAGGKLQFFQNDAGNRLGFMLVQTAEKTVVTIKLHTINSISSECGTIVNEMLKWYRATIDQSLNLGIGAVRERKIYFGNLDSQLADCRDYVSKRRGKRQLYKGK